MTDTLIRSLDGQEFNAYVATPSGQNGPGLIVIQELFGVNASMRALCDSFAEKGYIAVCPNLFWRQAPGVEINDASPDEWPRAFDLYKSFDVEAGVRDLLATLAHMRRFPGCSGLVGTVGYGLGGKLSFLMGARSDVECAVSYYGTGIETQLDEVSDVRMPMLLHIAEHDKFVPPITRQRILIAASRNPVIKMELYIGTEHAFARPTSQTFNAFEAEKANKNTLSFLGEFLKDKVKR